MWGDPFLSKLDNIASNLPPQMDLRFFTDFLTRYRFPGFVRRLNWDHTGDVTHWVRPIRPSGYSKVPAVFGPIADYATHYYQKAVPGILIFNSKARRDDLVPLSGDKGKICVGWNVMKLGSTGGIPVTI